MAAVGVDNDASVSRSARTESYPFACRRWRRRPTSIRHVVDYDRHLRRLRRHYEIHRDALLNGLQHNLTSIEVSGAADLRLLVRLVNAAGEPQRPTPDRPLHLDRTAESLPTQLHRGRPRVERPSVVGIQPLPGTGRRRRSARPATAVRPKVEIRMSSIRIGPLCGNSCSKSLSPATPTAGRPTPVASGTSVMDGSPAVGSLWRSTTVQSWESLSFIRISQLLAVMSPTQDRRPAGRSQGRACQHAGKNREDGGQLRYAAGGLRKRDRR